MICHYHWFALQMTNGSWVECYQWLIVLRKLTLPMCFPNHGWHASKPLREQHIDWIWHDSSSWQPALVLLAATTPANCWWNPQPAPVHQVAVSSNELPHHDVDRLMRYLGLSLSPWGYLLTIQLFITIINRESTTATSGYTILWQDHILLPCTSLIMLLWIHFGIVWCILTRLSY